MPESTDPFLHRRVPLDGTQGPYDEPSDPPREPDAATAQESGALLPLADDLVDALRRKTGSAAYIGQRFAGCASHEDRLPERVMGLGDALRRSCDALQVCLSHAGLVRRHVARSFGRGVIEGERQRVLATKETVGSCATSRQVRSGDPVGSVFRDMGGTAPKSNAGSSAAGIARRAPFIQARRLFAASLFRSAPRAVSGTAGLSGVSMSVQGSKADLKLEVKQTLQTEVGS